MQENYDSEKINRGQLKESKCTVCDKTFIRMRKLTLHVNTVHKNLRCYICNLCSKSFKTKEPLDVHMKIIHENIKAYKCDFCVEQYRSKNGLRHHKKCS